MLLEVKGEAFTDVFLEGFEDDGTVVTGLFDLIYATGLGTTFLNVCGTNVFVLFDCTNGLTLLMRGAEQA